MTAPVMSRTWRVRAAIALSSTIGFGVEPP
jgi:hypothetical protein